LREINTGLVQYEIPAALLISLRASADRFVIVKFPENPQGEIVLANEFLCCQLAEHFQLPVNQALLVSIRETLVPESHPTAQLRAIP
jgi:hypothetical protein